MYNLYCLGGSPCCGKSTIAEMISKKYGFQYYKADDFLWEFIAKGANGGDEWLKYISGMSLDRLWLREPEKLKEEEFATYGRLFPYFMDAINKLDKNTPIITEGAAFLPSLMNEIGVGKNCYVCVVPSKEFQITHYSKRLWVNDYLSSCSDKEKAFINWMERDGLFALSVLEQAKEIGYATLVVDGSKNAEENFQFVVETFVL